ncbi:DUF1192 domain-containing protein [Pelagibacterium sediminicola]|uniref:DUF1192 domain-containing protein n=1 Tax=Pelagibacterium sediminicola TaxID=2248761 RepID=UPI000E31AA8E|nr:DUF1192 domain-containing protein [Pelagibacterium sediminicola]
MDEDDIVKKPVHEVGMALDALSIEELTQRIVLLREEIVRLEKAIEVKTQSRSAADSVFKF